MIRYCPHNEIDKKKWDECISSSSLCLPYAFSWYLDIVSPGWDALIAGNYESIMPLPFKQKWLITYVYKPYFAQQLGLFSPEDPGETLLHEFIQAIPGKFRYIHTNLNESNPSGNLYTRKLNINHLIRIDRSYNSIYKEYSRNCRRNIKKAEDAGLTLDYELNTAVFVEFVFNNLGKQIPGLDTEQRAMLEKIIATARQEVNGKMIGIYTRQQELCAAGFFMQTNDRQIFSVCASNETGKQFDAMYLLVNGQIRKSAGQHKWFDFSGSNIKGIAYFNQSFSAITLTYPTLHLNRLPLPMRWIKK